jgi:PDDEXK-like domain of unknown function (DUF3799)
MASIQEQIMAVPAPEIWVPDFEQRPLSYSSLKQFTTPAHFVEYLRQKKEVTPAMRFGNLVDCLVLTPDDFPDKYIIVPEDMPARPSSASYETFERGGKNAPHVLSAIKRWQEFEAMVQEQENAINTAAIDQAAAAGLPPPRTKRIEVITQEWFKEALLIANRVHTNPVSKKYLAMIEQTQVRMKWRNRETDLPVVGFIDGDSPSVIVDFKTAEDASREGFISQAYKLGYHIQCGAYLDGAATLQHRYPDYVNIVVEKSPPYGVAVYRADKDYIKLGSAHYQFLLQSILYCKENNLWHETYEYNKPFGYHHLELPAWGRRELERYL